MTNKMDEMVAVIPRDLVAGMPFPGFVSTAASLFDLHVLMQQVKYKRRGDVEEDERWLQVIPYMYVWDPDVEKVFVYRRSTKSGEKRLHRKLSLGLGGHLNEEDGRHGRVSLLGTGARRELNEELCFDPPIDVQGLTLTTVGALLLDTTPVDRVHLGVVMRVSYGGNVTPNGDEVIDYFWSDPDHLDELDMEGWSEAIVAHLQKLKK